MDDLDLIKQRINIVDLIQEYFPLKKSGVNFKSNCPFHQENTPSFVVSPERGIWHCFGCNKGGDIFKFLMEKESIDFKDAVEILARKVGVTLQKKSNKVSLYKDTLLEINQKTADFFHYLLLHHQLGKKAYLYLKQRGINDETITSFKLGYAPNSWDTLSKFLIKRGYKTQDIIKSGLGVPSKRGCYDRFRGRVIFPLVDSRSNIIGFSGRILDKGEPKYINSPQTEIFDKSTFLFGLNMSKSDIRSKNQAILTEGEMDMLLSYQSGIKNVIASKGTALTEGQISLIKRYTDTILLCFDMDFAGDAAARRGIEIADRAGLNIKIIKIEGGKDPAELAQKDPKAWENMVKEAENIYDYYLRSATMRYDLKSIEGKKAIASEILPLISKISDSLVIEHYIQKLSALIAIPEHVLRDNLHKNFKYQIDTYKSALKTTNTVHLRPRRELLEEYLIVLLLKMPQSLIYVPKFPETLFLSEDCRSLYIFLVLYLDSISFITREFNISDYIKTLPPELVIIADRLYLIEIDDKLQSADHWTKEVDKTVSELKKLLIKASLERLSALIKNAQTFGKIERLESLNKRFRDLSVKLKSL